MSNATTNGDVLARLRALRDQLAKVTRYSWTLMIAGQPREFLFVRADDLDGLLTQLEQEMKETHDDHLSRVDGFPSDPPLGSTASSVERQSPANDDLTLGPVCLAFESHPVCILLCATCRHPFSAHAAPSVRAEAKEAANPCVEKTTL